MSFLLRYLVRNRQSLFRRLATPLALPAFLANARRSSAVSWLILALPPSEAFLRISSRSISSGVRRFAMQSILP